MAIFAGWGKMVNGKSVRGNDAIALAVHYDPPLPILVDDEVLDQVT